jgi:hypothetical protein
VNPQGLPGPAFSEELMIDVEKLLDPMGETLRATVRGRRGAGRLEVELVWPQVQRALDAGISATVIWEILSKNGLVSLSLRGFHRAMKARRERASDWGTIGQPDTEARASLERPQADPPAAAEKTAVKPRGSWRRLRAQQRTRASRPRSGPA